MQRSRVATGETTASHIKSLVLYAREVHGAVAADELLARLELSPSDLADETNMVATALWLVAVEAFVERFGREALADTWRGAIDPDNLGVWMHVVRGATTPEDAFRQLEGHGGADVRTGRWETLDAGPGRWHGRLLLSHDPRLERDGLLALARAAELRAIPRLFGWPAAVVDLVSNAQSTFASRTGSAFQEFRARWSRERSVFTTAALAVGGGALGASAAFVSHALGAACAAGGVVGGGAIAMLDAHRRVRRAGLDGQQLRLLALERGLNLRESRPRPTSIPLEGEVIAGTYRLGQKLDSGANGVIHAGARLSDQLPVAIKLLRVAAAHDAVASDRLRREAEAMGLAWHPNVVELLDHGVSPDGTPYLVMELLHGESLAARLARNKRLTPAESLPIALAMCDVLGAIHAAGVIHRDIKPSNIFLVADDESVAGERVKLLDFGIARVEWAETRITLMGAPVGTPGYMSPEQSRGADVDARSDLYSLGAVLTECLSGIVPRAAGAPSDQAPGGRSPSDTPSGVQRAAYVIPPAWQAVLSQAMAPRARDRFPDARAMRDALARLVGLDGDVRALS